MIEFLCLIPLGPLGCVLWVTREVLPPPPPPQYFHFEPYYRSPPPHESKNLSDCYGGCSKLVVREVPPRRPYSQENLTSFSRQQPFLPPVAFDFPYPGRLTVTRVGPEEMRLVCPLPKSGQTTVGCAHVGRGRCEIIALDDQTLKALGWNYDILLRHELARCNGWPADHPGAELA